MCKRSGAENQSKFASTCSAPLASCRCTAVLQGRWQSGTVRHRQPESKVRIHSKGKGHPGPAFFTQCHWPPFLTMLFVKQVTRDCQASRVLSSETERAKEKAVSGQGQFLTVPASFQDVLPPQPVGFVVCFSLMPAIPLQIDTRRTCEIHMTL